MSPKAQQTFHHILDSAMACYLAKGVNRTTLDDVAKKGNVSRTTLYRYIKNGDDLLHQVLIRDAGERLTECEQAMRYHNNLASTLVDSILFFMRGRSNRPVFQLLFENQQSDVNSKLRLTPDMFRPMTIKILEPFFQREQEKNNIRPGVTLEMATELICRITLSLMTFPAQFINDEKALRQFLETMLVPAIVNRT